MAAIPPAARLARGATAHREGRLDAAEADYRAVLAAMPRSADALYLLGMVVGQRGALDEALSLLVRAKAAAPDRVSIPLGLAPLLVRAGRHAEAVEEAARAVALAPGQAAAHHALGDARLASGDGAGAIEAYLAAIGRDPSHRASYENAGVAMRGLGLLSDATFCFREALRRGPASAPLLANLAGLVKDVGEIDEALARYREALALSPSLPGLASNYLYTHHYADDLGPTAIRDAHAALGPSFGAPDDAVFEAPAAGRRLRVGYVSPDVRQHSVAYFLEPVLSHHAGVDAYVYADVPRPDEVTTRLASLVGPDRFRSLVGRDDDAARATIRADEIDVLVDLAGHTGHNRLGVFARRAARVQVTYLGYPGTTGVPAMDARITDAEADPEGADAHGTERLVRLPQGFLCYRPPDDAPDVAPSPAGLEGPLTFGSFNQLAKLSPGTLRLWARVLGAVPGARLRLKARGLGDAGTVASLAARLSAAGIDPSRVDCAGQQRDGRAHLASYGQLDVALDPFPYNGTTTTCEALWMGVPTIVLAGERHASRVGVSLLTRVGLPLVARDEDEYVAIAVGLDRDRAGLAAMRASLRAKVAASPLVDGPGFVASLEAAYEALARDAAPR